MVIVRIRHSDGATERLSFDAHEISIGRDQDLNDIVIPEASVSKNHALIARTTKGVVVTDLKSTNGTQVNGSTIGNAILVRHGDEIAIGTARIWIDPETFSFNGPQRMYDFESDGDSDVSGGGPIPLKESVLRDANGHNNGSGASTASLASLSRNSMMPPLPVLHDDEHHTLATNIGSDAPGPARGSRTSRPASATSENERVALAAGIATLVDLIVKATNIEAFASAAPPNADAVMQLDAIIRAQLKKIPDVSEELLTQIAEAARREFIDTGPIGPWLEDPAISRIQCLRYDAIELTRNGELTPSDLTFSSEAALRRALVRLARQSGKEWTPDELVVERRLHGGGRLVALLPPMAEGLCLTIRKHEPILCTMDELVADAVITDQMSEFLAHCMGSRTNIFVCGDEERSVLELVAALASVAPLEHRIAVLHDGGDVHRADRRTMSFALPVSAEDEVDALRAATLLDFEHTMVVSPKARVSASAIAAMTGGAAGVVIGLRARTLQRGLGLTTGELLLRKPGLPHEAATTLVSQAIEIGVELATRRDGAPRVIRIVEVDRPPAGTQAYVLRDLFTATGASPRLARADDSHDP